ncbi:2-amino-4-hydroxy-6-hydroxymethyldihydropteridine diphosphokinase [Desulfobulbus sp.]|uniref:2-amino-4-hydroxy-6- hydroxymethyldihydropteridine diphosphokinase n=1 Tax=Desulfobulbus sp. TaxID=895 RepID=UPI00286EC609|nr:2-amino-4-hydroxy-6-hydroxymethyldihydropteridine diphosphokinase [Desulfobulbus sp.]
MKSHAADAGTDGHVAALGFGSNLGQSRAILAAAWRELGHCPGIAPIVLSSPYRSQPLDMISDNWFVNAAALVRTTLSPEALLRVLQAVETRHGRRRDSAASAIHRDRTLDLDLLLYDNLLLTTECLVVPHPRLAQRLFVLAPLTEIAASRLHPGCGKTIGTLLAELQQSDHDQLVEQIAW